ncbi:hypothetical protein RMSM_04322, partial [Rhodopirellula maiorica SM1]
MIERAKDLDSFNAELQLKPTSQNDSTTSELWDLQSDEVAGRTRPLQRNEMPDRGEIITGFIDVQQTFLSYTVMAFDLRGRGYVMDYGTFPEQPTRYYQKGNVTNTLKDEFGDLPLADLITSGLDELVGDLMAREFIRDQRVFSIDKLGIDNRFALVANDIRSFVLESTHKSRLVPQLGHFIGVNSRAWQKLSGGKVRRTRGVNVAYRDPPKGIKGVQELHVDTNYWKCQLASGLSVPMTSQTAISLYEDAPQNHLLLGEHCESEQPFWEENKNGDKLIVWKAGSQPCENEKWDEMTGCMALASTLGVFAKSKKTNTGQSGGKKKRGSRAYNMNLNL